VAVYSALATTLLIDFRWKGLLLFYVGYHVLLADASSCKVGACCIRAT